MIDFHRVVREFPGRIGEGDCGERCSGAHQCCLPNQVHPLLPGEGAFMADHGFDIRFSYNTGDDCWECPGKERCAGLLRPVVCRTYPIHPSTKGLMVDTECSEAPWLSWDFINQMERMWRYLFASDDRVFLWVAKYDRLVWSHKPVVPVYELKRNFDADYVKRFRHHFDLSFISAVFDLGWIRPGDKLLDVGGGAGERIPILGPRGVETTVLDINPELAKTAGGVVGSVESIPFPDAEFDVVYCFDVLEHCDDPGLGLREMLRVSKDRVVVYVTTMADMNNLLLDPTHKVFLPFSEWLRLFNSVADIVTVDYAHTGALLRKKEA